MTMTMVATTVATTVAMMVAMTVGEMTIFPVRTCCPRRLDRPPFSRTAPFI